MDQRTTHNKSKKTTMSANCKRRSSSADIANLDKIRRLMSPVNDKSKLLVLSPSKGGRLPRPAPVRHTSVGLACTFSASKVSSKLRAVKRRTQEHGDDYPVRIRGVGIHHIDGFRGYLWVGPVLTLITEDGWTVMDVTEACSCTVYSIGADLVPRQTVLSFNDSLTSGNQTRPGVVTRISVTLDLPCLRLIHDIDNACVKYWAPHKRLIYAYIPTVGKRSNIVAANITSKNIVECLHCGKAFGRSTIGLCQHMGLTGSLSKIQFHTFSVK